MHGYGPGAGGQAKSKPPLVPRHIGPFDSAQGPSKRILHE